MNGRCVEPDNMCMIFSLPKICLLESYTRFVLRIKLVAAGFSVAIGY